MRSAARGCPAMPSDTTRSGSSFTRSPTTANFLSTLALPAEVEQWSLTTLREKLVKIGAPESSATAATSYSSWPKWRCRERCSPRSCAGSTDSGYHRWRHELGSGHAEREVRPRTAKHTHWAIIIIVQPAETAPMVRHLRSLRRIRKSCLPARTAAICGLTRRQLGSWPKRASNVGVSKYDWNRYRGKCHRIHFNHFDWETNYTRTRRQKASRPCIYRLI
jgi:hypothetical protein